MRRKNQHLFGISFVKEDLLNLNIMPLLFTPNIVFTSFIKIDGRIHEFNFRKKNDAVYEADSTDARGNRIIFELSKQSENWTITSQNLPSWVIHNEDLVIDAIEKQ
jgi:hypothetical protein